MKIIVCLVLGVFLCASPALSFDADSSCVRCHGDKEKLEQLGFPQLHLDPAVVDEEVGMAGVPTCVDCHLGNSAASEKEDAHQGLLRPFYAAVGKDLKYQAVGRDVVDYAPIEPRGTDRTRLLLRQPSREAAQDHNIQSLQQLFYHDHDRQTLAYQPDLARRTCGKCHATETEGYNRSGMGLNKYQRGFTSWTTSPPGPHNCGAWFGDNYEKIAKESNRNYTEAMNAGLERACNKCHAGCNDCHYEGFTRSEGRHVFNRQPPSLSCAGSGRGTICHAGPMDRRRGAGFMREEFAFPVDELPPDVHRQMGMDCVDCHSMKNHDYGMMAQPDARKACRQCHPEIVSAVSESQHDQVDCSSCHVQAAGAYQFTFYGPGKAQGQFNIFTKHKQYYGVRDLPTLVKHPATERWLPMKPYPMGVMNIDVAVEATGLMLRTIPETTVEGNERIGEPASFTVARTPEQINDMYIITGTVDGLGENNAMLGWIQLDKMSHALGSGRECDTCHGSHEQVSTSWYTYDNPNDVRQPFSGAYTVKASRDGLFFSGFTHSEIQPVEGRKVSDFAPFAVIDNVWDVEGVDLSIPFVDETYEKQRSRHNLIYARLHHLKTAGGESSERLEELRSIEAILPHNQDRAEKMLDSFEAQSTETSR
ncbi:MAG: cytochrome c3 family protein [Desulfuromonadales bacterium]